MLKTIPLVLRFHSSSSKLLFKVVVTDENMAVKYEYDHFVVVENSYRKNI